MMLSVISLSITRSVTYADSPGASGRVASDVAGLLSGFGIFAKTTL